MKLLAEEWEQRIQACASFQELRTLRISYMSELHARRPLLYDLDTISEVNRIHDRLIQRVIGIAEQRLVRESGIPAPHPYAFLLFGSGGRAEQTLWSDQDNGIIHLSDDGNAISFFKILSARIEEGLEIAGYPPCPGQVSVTSERWRNSLSGWTATLEEWFSDASWENVRQLLVFADARVLYGNHGLFRQVRQFYRRKVKSSGNVIEAMLNNTLRHKAVLGPMGNLIRERYGEDAGGFDLKYGLYIPLVNAVRLLSIRFEVDETSTIGRLGALVPSIGLEESMRWSEAFLDVMKLRAMTPMQITEEGFFTTRGKLASRQLTKETAARIKDCIRIGEQMQKYIKKVGDP